MSYATLAGLPVLEAHVDIPRAGAWHATVRVDADTLPAGLVTLDVGGLSLVGTPRLSASRVVDGTAHVFLVGGAGRLNQAMPAAAYRNTPISVPLREVLSAVGETLAPESDAAVLSKALPFWTRTAGTAGRALSSLAAAGGVGWRVLPSGAVWLGAERWKAAAGSYDVLEEQPLSRSLVLFSEAPRVLPGTVLYGRPVAHVRHHVSADYLRCVVTFEETR